VSESDDAAGRGRRRSGAGTGVRVGVLFGIPIYATPAWFVVALVITWLFQPRIETAVAGDLGGWSYLIAFLYAVLLYASVIAHELSHSLVAKGFGLPVHRISLHILGGVSEIGEEPPTPRREFAVSAAGPALSLVVGGGAYALSQALEPSTVVGVLVQALAYANLLVGVFNLLPGLPLDGGRVVRAAVWAATGNPITATRVAARSGQALAVLVMLAGALVAFGPGSSVDGLLVLLWAGLLAGFIWVGANQALLTARLRGRLTQMSVRGLSRRAIPVASDLPLSEAIRLAQTAGAGALVVVGTDGIPHALVSEATVTATPEHRRPWTLVGDVARSLHPGLRVGADFDGERMVRAMNAHPATEYLVVEDSGEVFGVLAASDVERALASA
jgi:Zn-dependent protease/CBS domain-containing protein